MAADRALRITFIYIVGFCRSNFDRIPPMDLKNPPVEDAGRAFACREVLGQLAESSDLTQPLRPIRGVEEIQVVGALPDAVFEQCGLATAARSVWMHPDVVRKIEGKRPGAVDFTLNHLSRVILEPDYCGLDPRDAGGRRIDLVHLVAEFGGRPLFVSVKLVHAADAGTGDDELWVSTAHPLPTGFLTQGRYACRFRAVGS